MRIHVLSVGMVALAALAPLGSAETARSLDETLALVSARLSEVRTLRSRELWRMEFEVQGMKQITEMENTIVFERPKRIHLKTQAVVVVSDGSNAFVRVPMARKYMSLPAADTLDQVLGSWKTLLAGVTPEKKALFSTDVTNALREALQDGTVEVLPDEEVDGRDCFVLRHAPRETMPVMGATALKLWLDKEWGILRRAESFTPPEAAADSDADEEDGAHWRKMFKNMRCSATVLETAVNGPVSDEDFVFTPEPGETKMESPFGLAGSSRGASAGFERFALSGKPAPDFSLALLDGPSFSLSAQTGSVVLIDFWATWCGPCVRALPEVKALDEQYRSNGLVVVGVSRDRPAQKDKVAEMVREKGLAYPVGLDADPAAAERYGVEGIPCMVLIGRDGVVQGRKVGFSSGSLNALKKDIEAVLAGQSIPGSQPLTEAEIRDLEKEKTAHREWSRKSTALDTNVFRLVWESKGEGRREGSVSENKGADVCIVPSLMVLPRGEELAVLRTSDGAAQYTVPWSGEIRATNEMGRPPAFFFLQAGTGGVIVSVQTFYDAKREGESVSYSTRQTRLGGIALDGSLVWTQSLDRSWYVQSADVVPCPDGSDVLMLASHDGQAFYDAAGRLLLRQRLGYGYRSRLFRAPPDHRLQMLLEREDAAALYDVVLAPAAGPSDP